MLILKTVGLVIIFLSWLILCWLIPRILEEKYDRESSSTYWYLWGLTGMGAGIAHVFLLY